VYHKSVILQRKKKENKVDQISGNNLASLKYFIWQDYQDKWIGFDIWSSLGITITRAFMLHVIWLTHGLNVYSVKCSLLCANHSFCVDHSLFCAVNKNLNMSSDSVGPLTTLAELWPLGTSDLTSVLHCRLTDLVIHSVTL
jgi:hypothetical protein